MLTPAPYRHNPLTKTKALAEIAVHEKAAKNWRRIAAQPVAPLERMQLGNAVTTLPARAITCAEKREADAAKLRALLPTLPE